VRVRLRTGVRKGEIGYLFDEIKNVVGTDRLFASAASASRPIMFLYNGGPSVASLWLHMGAFGPRRISLPDASLSLLSDGTMRRFALLFVQISASSL
jgi:carboxypeptidase C (cathepsin A)